MTNPIEQRARALVKAMTTEEKCAFVSGADFWSTQDIPRLGIPRMTVSDGPHGLRKQAGSSDHLGLNESLPATCYPAGATLACSWDRELMQSVGKALGEECRAEGVGVLLGPAVNMKRSPLCGRSFEYLSEDPVLAGELAAAYITGLQSEQVGASLKHFAMNNQEDHRMSVDVRADMRATRELYLKPFEIAVKKAQPWTVMCAYNRIGGVYASEHPWLLTQVLRGEWGFEGMVVSDWGAVSRRGQSLAAGMDLEMPGKVEANTQRLREGLANGVVSMAQLDTACERILSCVLRAAEVSKKPFSHEEHHRLAVRASEESAVLLRNEGGALPLREDARIAVIGEFAQAPRYQGGGSSHIRPWRMDVPLDAIQERAKGEVFYAPGYRQDEENPDGVLEQVACTLAHQADVTVAFVGLPERYESEGYDRKHMRMPENQTHLLECLAGAAKRLVVVMMNGAPVEMPWAKRCDALLDLYLGGQGCGTAVARLLFGDVNPSGKLAETLPLKLAHTPAYLHFPGSEDQVIYGEGIFIGYRYYEKTDRDVAYPFGFGLSYTRFAYSGLTVEEEGEGWRISVNVRNTGAREGQEIAQLYVGKGESDFERPIKELKGFEKIRLAPGEEKRVTFSLAQNDLAIWSIAQDDWIVEGGEYTIYVGGCSAGPMLTCPLSVRPRNHGKEFGFDTCLSDILRVPGAMDILMPYFQRASMTESDEAGNPVLIPLMQSGAARTIQYNSGNAISPEELEHVLAELNALRQKHGVSQTV